MVPPRRGPRARPRDHPHLEREPGRIRSASPREQPLRKLPGRPPCVHGEAGLALPGGSPRPLGLRRRHSLAGHRAPQRGARARGPHRHQEQPAFRRPSRDGQARVPGGGAQGAGEHGTGRRGVAHSALLLVAPPRTHPLHPRRRLGTHPGRPGRVPREGRAPAERGDVHAPERRGDAALPLTLWRGGVGRSHLRSGTRDRGRPGEPRSRDVAARAAGGHRRQQGVAAHAGHPLPHARPGDPRVALRPPLREPALRSARRGEPQDAAEGLGRPSRRDRRLPG